MSGKIETWLNYIVLSVLTLVVMIPVVWLVATALSPNRTGLVDLSELRWGNFATAWTQAEFGLHLRTSLVLAVTVVAAVAVLTVLAGYALTVLQAPGGNWLFALFLAGIMIPLEGIIVPLYYDLRSYNLTGSLVGLVIAHVGLSISFGVFWVRASLRAVPRELVESAMVDGAGSVSLLLRIVLPVIRPALTTLLLLVFMWTWNDYFLAFVLMPDQRSMPVTVALGAFSTKYSNEVNLMSAAAVLISIPVLVLYVIFQRQFIQGVLSGALKE